VQNRLDFRLLLARVQFGTGLVFVASFVAFAIWGRFPIPYRDDWDWLYAYLTQPFTLSAQFEPHNEHLIPLARLLFAAQYSIEGLDFRFSFVVALAAQLLIGWVFWRQVRARWRNDAPMRWFAWGLAAVCLFLTYQLQSVVFVAAILFPLVQLFAVIACDAASRASAEEDTPRIGRTIEWCIALVAALAAALTTTNGLVVPAIVALFGLTNRRRISAWMLFVLAAFLVTYVLLYLDIVGRPWEHAAPGPPPATPMATVEFFLSFFSSGLLYAGRAAGAGIGAIVLAAGCLCFLVTARDGARRPRIERFACGLLLFTIASAVMTTVGRAQYGTAQAAQSRYGTYTLVYWAALTVWALSRIDMARGHRRMTVPLMASAVTVTACALFIQVFVGLVWIAKKDNLRAAGLALRTGVDDEEWISTLHPITQTVYGTRSLLVSAGTWPLADAQIGTPAGMSVSNHCDGRVQMVKAPGGAGWRVAGVVHTAAQHALIADRAGLTIGLAEPAPAVAVPNPSQMEVVRTVWHELTTNEEEKDRWFGLARIGAGAPYTLVAIGEHGQPDCALPIRSSND
jgi:hypothetical protein